MKREAQAKIAAAAVVICGAVVLVLTLLWPVTAYEPRIRLPEGVSLAAVLRDGKREPPKGWHTNIYCLGARPAGGTLDFWTRARLTAEKARYEMHELLGQSLDRVPNPPIVDYVTPRLGECFDTSGEKYLLAKEFLWEMDPRPQQDSNFIFLAFVWGGTNRVRHARDRIESVENGIVQNGIFGFRPNCTFPKQADVQAHQFLFTNRCAVLRDTKGLVKIVPLDWLRDYAEAGLVTLPP